MFRPVWPLLRLQSQGGLKRPHFHVAETFQLACHLLPLPVEALGRPDRPDEPTTNSAEGSLIFSTPPERDLTSVQLLSDSSRPSTSRCLCTGDEPWNARSDLGHFRLRGGGRVETNETSYELWNETNDKLMRKVPNEGKT